MYLNTLYENTRALLEKLYDVSFLDGFRLVGGTALALQIGHRKSIDLDFFTREKIDPPSLLSKISQTFETEALQEFPAGLLLNVENIKVDIIRHDYPWLKEAVLLDKIDMASITDIAAMKLNAICGRGSKKDFYDLYTLLNYFSLQEMVELFEEKYANHTKIMVLKSLAYFEDAELDLEPEMLEKVSWEKVKSRILTETRNLKF